MKEFLALTENERKALEQNFVQEPDSFYTKAENDQLIEALNRTYTERFLVMTRLMKMNRMLSKAKITFNNHPVNNH
jgi:hypothetical protein